MNDEIWDLMTTLKALTLADKTTLYFGNEKIKIVPILGIYFEEKNTLITYQLKDIERSFELTGYKQTALKMAQDIKKILSNLSK